MNSQSHPQPPPLAYTIKSAGAAMGLSRATLYRLMDRGDLPSFVVGSRRLILRKNVNAFLERVSGETIEERAALLGGAKEAG